MCKAYFREGEIYTAFTPPMCGFSQRATICDQPQTSSHDAKLDWCMASLSRLPVSSGSGGGGGSYDRGRDGAGDDFPPMTKPTTVVKSAPVRGPDTAH